MNNFFPGSNLQFKKPILLFNDECAVCRGIAKWLKKSAKEKSGEPSIVVEAIGEDPSALARLNAELNIWQAYATIHLLMPDGSMKIGGEAVAEVLRRVPKTKWFAWTFRLKLFGVRPFQSLLNMAYTILADIRPIFGCESCGEPSLWMKPLQKVMLWVKHSAPIKNYLKTPLQNLKGA